MSDHSDEIKLELAAKKIEVLVGDKVGRMLFAEQIIFYGNTDDKKQRVYKTLEGYGYQWTAGKWLEKEGEWSLTIPKWINELVAASWDHHEITR